MTFMSSLASNPSSGVYGQSKQTSDQDVLGIVNQMKDREMSDFKDKATFMADLSNRQERMRNVFDPSGPTGGMNANPNATPAQGGQGQRQQPMNTVMARDPNEMTGYEKGELGVKQQGMNLESQKINQAKTQSDQALGIKQQQEKLNQQKSDQIHDQKMADMQRKSDEADQKIQLATQALNNKNNTAEQALAAHKDMAAAVEERHKLELAQKDAQFQKTADQHQQTIKALEDKVKQGQRTVQTKKDSSGNSITTTTEKGDAINAPIKNSDGTYTVTGPDGKKGKIPADKLDDWNQNHQPDQPQQDQEQQ